MQISHEPEITEYIEALKVSRKFGPQVVSHKVFPHEKAVLSGKSAVDSATRKILDLKNINSLYAHQHDAMEHVQAGSDVLVCTPTASGKSMIYNIPVIRQYLEDPLVHALYLFPLKALAQDQLRVVKELISSVREDGGGGSENFAAIYDGDTSSYQRAKIRKAPPPILMTNPEMVHLGILPFHETWSQFFKKLKFVIIDEVHSYRGVFGSHMSWLLRRFRRVARYYGSDPVFILLSATIGNPKEFGAALLGRDVAVVSSSGAPRYEKHMVLVNPWDSAAYTASQLLEAAVKRGLRTIVYTKSRKMTELITMWTKPRLGVLGNKLSSYRAGFMPEERRTIEKDLAQGKLLGVISTSALELGIDIGDLDLCILVGYPGSIMATWQRSGRVGRGMRTSATVFIGAEDALDQHFMRNPEDLFSRAPENAALNPMNSKVARQHLLCAAAEIPVSRDESIIETSSQIIDELEYLTEQAELFLDKSGTTWFASRKRPHRHVHLRGGGVNMSIIDAESGEIVGEIDGGRSLKETHPGAVYLHNSEMMQVTGLDLEGHEVLVKKARPTFYTRPIVDKQTEIIKTISSKTVLGCRVSFGTLRVTEKVTGYKKINNGTQKVITTIPLDLPEQVIETEGLWMDIREGDRLLLEKRQMHFMGAIHAVEHAMIAMFPLLVLCDRNDIGGISCPRHEQTECASIFIYDGYNGGAGLCLEAFSVWEKLVRQTWKTIKNCPCETGCPSCVHSPKCGSGNRPIDKSAALTLLERVIETPYSERQIAVTSTKNIGDKDRTLSENKNKQKKSGKSSLELLPPKYGVFDLETKKSAGEVGGWGRADRMGVSVGVIYDSSLDGYVTYLEDEISEMIEHLHQFDLIIGFNNKRFDNRVLMPYTSKNLAQMPSIDLLEEIYNRLGYRLSLDRLAEHTLGTMKSASGVQALTWYRNGEIKKIADYCKKDVLLTKNLFLHALENGFLLFKNKAGSIVRLPLDIEKRIVHIVGI